MKELTRRSILRASVIAAVGTAAGAALTSCTTESQTSPGGQTTGGQALIPTFKAFEGVKPDLKGDNATGRSDAFFSYPNPAAQSVAAKPVTSGKAVTGMITISTVAPTPMASNKWWQTLNANLGAELQVDMSVGGYADKLAARVASNDLPDLVFMSGATRLPSLMPAKFADLTEILSGDSALEYPNIANLPSQDWASAIINRRIYGIPSQLLSGVPIYVRMDVLKGLGIDFNPKNADEVKELLVKMSDASVNRYAIGRFHDLVNRIGLAMFGAPMGWKQENGSFTHYSETDEYANALEWGASVFSAGGCHPDMFGSINAPQLFMAGKIVILNWGPGSFQGLFSANIDGLELGFWAPPKANGGGVGNVAVGIGANQFFVGISKQDSVDRLKELVRVVDYMSSPFGSSEYLQMQYGTEGTHFTWDKNHNPVTNDLLGREQPNSEFRYLGGRQALYTAGHDDATKAMYEYEKIALPTGTRDASNGLHSETLESNPQLLTSINDVCADVVRGRKTIADFKKVVAEWRAAGGDQARSELEEQYAANN